MNNKKLKSFFLKNISTKQAADSGMALVLILLLISFFTKNDIYFKISIPVLVLTMAIPRFFYPFAIIWFGLSNVLGTIMSKIILTIVYFLLVLPIGLIRKAMGKDTLQLRNYSNNSTSVLKVRNHKFTSKDIEYPY